MCQLTPQPSKPSLLPNRRQWRKFVKEKTSPFLFRRKRFLNTGIQSRRSKPNWLKPRAIPSTSSTMARPSRRGCLITVTSSPGPSRTSSRAISPCWGFTWRGDLGGTATACRWRMKLIKNWELRGELTFWKWELISTMKLAEVLLPGSFRTWNYVSCLILWDLGNDQYNEVWRRM